MKDIFSQVLTDKIASAKEAKQGKHKEKIQLKLLELQNFISTLDQKKQSIADEDSYQKYIKFLKDAIESTIEQITAPTVDDFIAWVEQLTDNRNEHYKTFRKYLISNFSDSISTKIDSVLSAKDILENENVLFSSLLSEARKAIRKDCNVFLDKPAEFENNIDGFLEKLDENLTGLVDIEELTYIKIEDLYSEEQKNNNIDFYVDIIEKFVKINQKLDAISDSEKTDTLITKMKRRIEDIEKCINQLDKTTIANSSDETVRDMFLSFKDDIVKFEKGINQNFEEFLSQKWDDIITHYDTVKAFFNNVKEITDEDAWKSFKAKDEITIIVLKYNATKKENPLASLKSKSMMSIQQTLTKKFNEINDYEEEAKKTKQAILDAFSNTVKEYTDKLDLIEKLDTDKSTFNQIKDDGIEALKNGYESLKDQDIIVYLKDDFSSDLNTYNNIKSWFNEVLQRSGMRTKIDWLEEQLQSEDSGDISEINFDADILKELLLNKLVTLTVSKTY